MTIPALYEHQKKDIQFILSNPIVANLSDPGTGKTRIALEVIRIRRNEGRTLVICPKSIMQPAWGNDIEKFTPELTYNIAYSTNRVEAFTTPSDIVITNHDAVTALVKNTHLLNNFVQLFIDESTAYKNESQRTKAIFKLTKFFKYRYIMTGTPYTNSITDVWRQAFILDQGQRLGKSFYRFREHVCTSHTLGNGITIWKDKEGIEPVIYQLLSDISIRRTLEECVDIPANTTQIVPFTPNNKHIALYNELEATSILQLKNGTVTAFNAAVLRNKLLQLASGAVYTSNTDYTIIDKARYELIADLALARPQTIIAFLWRHQRDLIFPLLPNAAIIDGTVPIHERNKIVQRYQQGDLHHLLIHPQSGAHGLTLTAGHCTIWASPTYSSESFLQLNRRIYRAGQTKKTETLLIEAKNTVEELVYQKLSGKLEKATLLLNLFNLANKE